MYALVLFALLFTTTCTFILTARLPFGNPDFTLTPQPQLTPEIVDELKDFRHLIPAATIDELVAKHLLLDGNFRKALSFVRSTQFTQLLQNVQRIPEIIEILEFLHLSNNGGDGTLDAIDAMAPVLEEQLNMLRLYALLVWRWQQQLADDNKNLPLEIILLPNEVDANAVGVVDVADAASTRTLSSFSSFVEELMQHLPRVQYVEMINAKRRRNAAFAAFYTALRSTQFVAMVEAALKSANLAKTLKTLSGNDIDVHSLKPIAFRVLSWGPKVNTYNV